MRLSRSIALATLLVVPTMLGAQSSLPPKIEFENDRIRIERVTIPPGHKGEMHSHEQASIEIFLTDDHIRETLPNGTTRDWRAKAGEVLCIDPVQHRVENVRTAPTEILSIEFRGAPVTQCPKKDPRAATERGIEFENDRLWILRSKIGAKQQGPVHTHPEYVGILLTDARLRARLADGTLRELRGKRGDVSGRAPVTHSVENLADTPFEGLDVNLKATPTSGTKKP